MVIDTLEVDNGINEYLIKPSQEIPASELLALVAQNNELVGFHEVLPSMDEIFKHVVREGTHE